MSKRVRDENLSYEPPPKKYKLPLYKPDTKSPLPDSSMDNPVDCVICGSLHQIDRHPHQLSYT